MLGILTINFEKAGHFSHQKLKSWAFLGKNTKINAQLFNFCQNNAQLKELGNMRPSQFNDINFKDTWGLKGIIIMAK